jgi:hypothetical protein
VTLVTLSFAWLLVFAVFLAGARLRGPVVRRTLVVAGVEALVLTLLGGLWFGTAGRGGWLLVFVLLGALVAGADRGFKARGFWLDLARYVAAGAVLAWRLG